MGCLEEDQGGAANRDCTNPREYRPTWVDAGRDKMRRGKPEPTAGRRYEPNADDR